MNQGFAILKVTARASVRLLVKIIYPKP